MKKLHVRLLALFMCFVMCASLLPTGVASAEELTPEEMMQETPAQEPAPVEILTEEADKDNSVSEPQLPPEEAQVPVEVEFICTPEELTLSVFDAAEKELDPEAEAIEPEENGSYLLLPGKYLYTATCEGYVGVEYVEFTVDSDSSVTTKYLEISLDELMEDLISDNVSSLESVTNADTVDISDAITYAASYDGQYAWFPAPSMNLTQVAYENYSHGDQNAIDIVPGGNVYAPFTGKIAYVDSNWGYVTLQSLGKVYWADGTYDYMTVGFMHDENISDLYVGKEINQGTAFYQAGGMGDGNPNAYGDHVHITVHKGTITRGYPYGNGDQYAYNAFFINPAKTTSITNSGKAINAVLNGAPTDYSTLWKNIPTDYLSKCTYYPSYLTLQMTENYKVWSLPCSDETDPKSKVIYNATSSTSLTATGLYKNDVTSADHYWYQVNTPSGVGYVYAPYCKVTSREASAIKSGLTYTGKAVPASLPVSKSYPVDWVVKSSKADISSISGYIGGYGTTMSYGTSSKVREKALNNSAVDSAMSFDKITQAGTQRLLISATVKNYYCSDNSNTLKSETIEKNLIDKNIVFTSSTSTTPPAVPSLKNLATNYPAASYSKAPITFQWDAVSNADYYNLHVYTLQANGEYKHNEDILSYPSSPSITFEFVPGWYSIQIEAVNSAGITASDMYYFSVGNNAPASTDAEPVNSIEFNGHTYERYDYHMSWTDAKAYCEALGGHLVTITSAAENNTVISLLTGLRNGIYYIGCTDPNQSGNWSWVTGEKFSYSAWDVVEPSKDEGEYYGEIMARSYGANKVLGEWNDCPNSLPDGFYGYGNTGFICEYDFTDPCHSGHSWNSGTVTKQPTCTDTGVKTYTCTVCGEKKTETIPAAGHKYVSETIPGSCTQRPGKKYTCSVCHHSYTEYAEDNWSEWSTTRPSGIDESYIQTKTQYRYQNKETTTSSSSTMSGWTLYDTKTSWSEYGPWSGWNTGSASSSESTQVETATLYGYYYFKCPKCGAHMHGYGTCYTWAGGCGASTTADGWTTCWVPVSWDSAGLKDWYGTGKLYTTSLEGGTWFKWGDSSPTAGYRTRTRTQSTTYYFYRWSAWSGWSDSPVYASDTKNVETRTLYRYDLYSTAQHSWNAGVVTKAASCETDGIRTYTCTACGETRTEAIPATGHKWGSWTVVSKPTLDAPGTEKRTCQNSGCGKTETRSVAAEIMTVIFDPNGGTVGTTSMQAVKGDALTSLPTPTRDGYNFDGWYTAKTGGTKLTTSTVITSNLTVYAHWNAKTYTVTFNANGGTGAPAVQTKTHGTALTLSSTKPTRSGYTFLGWASSASASTAQYQPGASYTEDKNITLYAVWKINTYTVSFDANGGTASTSSVQVNHGGTVASLPTATLDGYDFDGWYTAKTGGTKLTTSTVITSNLTVYAHWNAKTYTVTFNANGGTGAPAVQTKTHGTALTLSSTKPTRSGYTFLGWASSASATTAQYQPGASYTEDKNITLYAVWKADTYTVTFDANGGTSAPAVQTKTHGTALTLSSTKPTRSGYTFIGWASSASASTAQYQPGASYTEDKNITLYAVWKINTYTVSFDANGGTASTSSVQVNHGGTVASLPTATLDGYDFDGWYTAKTGGTKLTTSTAITSNLTVYAHWNAKTYTVTFNANGGTGAPAVQTKTHGTALTLSSTKPTRSGYTFLGWASSASASTAQYQPGASYTENKNITLYAVWKADTYTVTFDANGGTGAPAVQTKTHGIALTLSSTKPTRSGYTFLGWASSASATTAQYQPGASYTENKNITLYAVWKADTYTVTFDANGGTGAPAVQTKTHGIALTLSSTKPTRSGYTFLGWASSASATTAQYQPGASYTENKNITLYAVWKADTYTVTFDANGGTGAPAVQTKTHGTALTLSSTKPTRSGYTFLGWASSASASTAQYQPGASYTENKNITLYAVWKINTYTVSFDANGGTASTSSVQVNHGGTVASLPTATLDGYDFDGWYTAKTGGTKLTTSTVITSNLTVYAHWAQVTPPAMNQGQLIVSSSSGRRGDTVSINISISENPGIAGFRFSVEYDSSKLTLLSCEQTGLTSGMWNIHGNQVMWANTSDTTYNGTFLNITFKIADDAALGIVPITLHYSLGDITNENTDDISPNVIPGNINIINRLAGDVNGDGSVNTKDVVCLMKFLTGENVFVVPGSPDINGDGYENTKDVILLMKYLTGEDVTIH